MPDTLRNPRPRTVGVRQSEPQGLNAFAQRGQAIIPRRGNHLELCGTEGWTRHAYGSPLRLLKILADYDPALSLALWNALTISCAPDDLRIEAVRIDDAQTDEMEARGNAALQELWDRLPAELGGLDGLQAQLTQEAYLTGLLCIEAVPGKRGQGIDRIWPVDSLSIGFRRDQESGEARPYQRQIAPKTTDFAGYTALNPETFFWHAVHAQVDDPYGRAPFATAVREIIADDAMMKDLADAMHNAAWPRLKFGFDFAESRKVGVEAYGLTEPALSEWVEARFREAVDAVGSLRPDDSIFYDSSGNGSADGTTPGDGFQALTGVLQFLRQRRIQALKSLPTLMGINDGSTQTYTTVEWAIYAKGIESIRSYVARVLVQAATLHLRLLGMPLKAKAVTKAIRTSDELVDANTLATRIANWDALVSAGYASREEASRDLLGHEPNKSDEEVEEMRQRLAAVNVPDAEDETAETVPLRNE